MNNYCKKITGKLGEDIAVNELLKSGYTILERNFTKRCGEIDIICRKNDIICFVEVKTRHNPIKALPREAVNLKKQKRIKETAEKYIYEIGNIDSNIYSFNFRFDVAEIMIIEDDIYFNYIENAFC